MCAGWNEALEQGSTVDASIISRPMRCINKTLWRKRMSDGSLHKLTELIPCYFAPGFEISGKAILISWCSI